MTQTFSLADLRPSAIPNIFVVVFSVFLVVFPQIVVISVGQDNKFGHPVPEVLERYTEHGFTVLRTDQQGTVELTTDGERLWVETAR